MEPIITHLPGSKVELKFTVTPEEAQPYIDKVVQEISTEKTIPGFRPGKAPYAEVKNAVGEMVIWEHALEAVVRAWFVKTVLDKQLQTVGSPEISVDQLTPGQELKFTCTVAVMPVITKAEEIKEPFVELKIKEVKDEDVEKAVQDLRKMKHEEVVTAEPATKDHMVVVDLVMTKDGVILEGGTANGYRVYLQEEHYIPKFADQLMGLKKGDQKKFTLPFPAEHYQKMYAGKDIDFEVNVKEVYEIKLPEVNDEFAKSLGVESVQALRDLLRKNMSSENEHHAMEAAEIELLESLVKNSSFTEVPEILIKEETRRMYEELRNDIEHRGGRMEDYLSSIKKSADEIKLDMIPQAIKRLQTSVYVQHVVKDQKLEVMPKELDDEIDRLLSMTEDPNTRERISSPDYREYVNTVMRNRKALEHLKEKGIKKYQEFMDRFAKEEKESEAKHGHVHGPGCRH